MISNIKTILKDQLNELLDSNEDLIRRFNFDESLRIPEITILTGVRRCGKSTLLKQLIKSYLTNWNIHYINFEDQRLNKFTVDNFRKTYEDFLVEADKNKKNLIVYDEVHMVDEWEKWVSSFSSNKNNKVFISGSNAKLLSTELSTLLTGRHEKKLLTPFKFIEIISEELINDCLADNLTTEKIVELRKSYNKYKTTGGFPRALISQSTEILKQYYEDIVLKDISIRKKIRNVTSLQQLSIILSSLNTRLFNKSKILEEVGVKDLNTLSKFCGYFEEAYLFSEVKYFSNSLKKQLRSISKFYAVDPVLAKVSGYHSSNSDYWILENFVYLELKKRYREVWYWHSKDKFELDFVAKADNGDLHGYQVAISISDNKTKERELRAIYAGFEEIKLDKATIITESELDMLLVKEKKVDVIPFYRWAIT